MKPYLKRAWAEISLSALEANIRAISASLQGNTQIMAVVKADAYGHGEAEILQKLTQIGIRYFAVSNLDEALHVRQYCPDSDVLILGYTPPEYADTLAQNNIIQGIVSAEYAYTLNARTRTPIRCHVKLDTGMGRIGITGDTPGDCADSIQDMSFLRNLKIEGIYTHFAVADMPDDPEQNAYTEAQKQFIRSVGTELMKRGVHLKHLHYLNSAGVLYHNDANSTLARVGIIMYGLAPNYPLPVPLDLKPVLSLKAVISHIKRVQPGTSISYGRTFQADHCMKIATVTVGYADGYSRLLSSKADVLVKGRRCPIVGRICMDQLMLDVSAIDDLRCGEIVTLIGQDGDEQITADELASLYGTIGYEVVCGISKRVPRIYVD